MSVERDVFPVTAYDVEDKKAVFICADIQVCSRYIVEKTCDGRVTGAYRKKSKMRKNRFGRVITLRAATPEQREFLGEHDIVVLDDRFAKESSIPLRGGFYTTAAHLNHYHSVIPNLHKNTIKQIKSEQWL
jgi:hypothetical protein